VAGELLLASSSYDQHAEIIMKLNQWFKGNLTTFQGNTCSVEVISDKHKYRAVQGKSKNNQVQV